MENCKAQSKKGEPCLSPATSTGYCFMHSEQHSQAADEARHLGGLHRQTPKSSEYPGSIKGLNDVVTWVNAALEDTWRQENSDRRSKSLSSLLRIAIEALEGSEIDKRLAQLEELIYANPKKNP